MKPIRNTIPYDQALAIVHNTAQSIERTSRISLEESDGRVVARDVVATRDVPPFDRAAMDGYAVIAEDTHGASRQLPKQLHCLEVVHTGNVPKSSLQPGHCLSLIHI